jgi:hypothetical protein
MRIMSLRKPARAREPLPVTMTGVRMGERVLQIGITDSALTGALAAKPGLSGHAAIVVAIDAAADRARRAGEEAGVLVDIQVTALDAFTHDGPPFDAVIVHAGDSGVIALSAEGRIAMLTRCWGALRAGGRVVTIENLPKSGLAGLLGRSAPLPTADWMEHARAAGFHLARVLGEGEGFRFVEGLKGAHSSGQPVRP